MTLLTYLKLNTSDLEAGVAKSKKELADLNAAASKPAGGFNPAGGSPGADLRQIAPNASKAVAGLNAVNAANGLMSGTATGAASGTIALSRALKGLGVAASASIQIAAIAAIVASLIKLAQYYLNARSEAKKLDAEIKLGNAQSGVDGLRKGFERLVDTMDGAVGLMRELRALTQEGVDIDADKRLAQIDLDRKRELSGLKPGDEKGAKEINSRYDRLRTGAELDKEAGANTAAAAEQRKQREENAAAIAERRQKAEQFDAAAKQARGNEKAALTSDPGFWKDFKSNLPGFSSADQEREQGAAGWNKIASTAADEASRIRKEIEELERKNQVLEEQAKIYERRNEVVAIKREAAGIAAPAKEEKQKSVGSSALNIPTDRLTRIGGVAAGGFGASFGGGVAEKQLAEARLTRQLLERIARKEPGGAVLG
jgi:hypothetical protein